MPFPSFFSKKRKAEPEEEEPTLPLPPPLPSTPPPPTPPPRLHVGDWVWYFRSSSKTIYPSLLEARKEGMAKQCMLVIVKQIHYDDMPNLYYTIGMLSDDDVVFQGRQSIELIFSEEKQTDACCLIPLKKNTT